MRRSGVATAFRSYGPRERRGKWQCLVYISCSVGPTSTFPTITHPSGETMPRTMRAAVFAECGGPEVVVVRKIPIPKPGPGEVRVKVAASSMNHLDLWMRRGLPGLDIPMPHIGGADVAGEVNALGAGVSGVETGTRVVVDPSLDYEWYTRKQRGPGIDDSRFRIIGEHTQGGFAEYCIAPLGNLLELPAEFPYETAAAAGLTFVTAWRALITRARVRPGERVLVTGASGGVGSAAVMIAKRAGATVFALTSGPENAARLRELGADEVYDRLQTPDFSRAVWRDTGKEGIEVVYDTVGDPVWEQCIRALGRCGRLVTSGTTGGGRGVTNLRAVFWKQLTVMGSTMGTPDEYRAVMRLVLNGELTPVIDRVLPLSQTRLAHELLEAGGVFGKLVLLPTGHDRSEVARATNTVAAGARE